MLSSSSSLSPPPALPLVLSLCASSALLVVLSSPLAFSASFSLLDVSTPLPDNSVLVQGLGVWGSCYTQGPCTFSAPFSSPPRTSEPTASLSTALGSPAHQAVSALLLLALISSISQHLLNAFRLFRALAQTPRTWTSQQLADTPTLTKRWATAAGQVGGVSSAAVLALLAMSILSPYTSLLFGRPVDQFPAGGAVGLGFGSLVVALAGFLMVAGARLSDPSTAFSRSMRAQDDAAEAGMLVFHAAKVEKAWLVLDVVMEVDEDGCDLESSRSTSPRFSPISPTRSRSRSPARFYLA